MLSLVALVVTTTLATGVPKFRELKKTEFSKAVEQSGDLKLIAAVAQNKVRMITEMLLDGKTYLRAVMDDMPEVQCPSGSSANEQTYQFWAGAPCGQPAGNYWTQSCIVAGRPDLTRTYIYWCGGWTTVNEGS